MEHECRKCGHLWLSHVFNEDCPKCGGSWMQVTRWNADNETDLIAEDAYEVDDGDE